MKRIIALFGIGLMALISCDNSSTDKEKELDLKEKEVALKEQALKLKEREDSIQHAAKLAPDMNTPAVTKTDELSNIENLIGYWFVPHGATINIRFNRDGHFVFNDYNTTLGKDETLQGTYQLAKGVLTLLYDDRPKQNFKFYKGEKGDNNYYIKSAGYYFVKGENGVE